MARKLAPVTQEELRAAILKLPYGEWLTMPPSLTATGSVPDGQGAAQVVNTPEKACKPGRGPDERQQTNSPNAGKGLGCRHAPCSLTDLTGRPVSRFYPDARPRAGRLIFTAKDWRLLTGPIVYAWVDRYLVMYVGMSSHGLRRLMLPHHVIDGVDRDRQLYLWPVPSIAEAKALEAQLIKKHRPPKNHIGVPPAELMPRLIGWKIRDGKMTPEHPRRSGPRKLAIPHYRSELWARLRGAKAKPKGRA